MPPAICVTDATSTNVRPSNSCGSGSWRGERGDPARRRGGSRCRRATAAPSGRRAPWKVHVALTLPRQPAWIALSVGSIITTSSAARSAARARAAASARSRRTAAPRGRRTAQPNGAPSRARARSSPRARPSCRWRRARARARRRGGPGRLPCAGTVSRWPASSTRRVRPGRPGGRCRRGRARRGSRPRTCVGEPRLVARLRGMSTSSSVRAARRSPSSAVARGGMSGHHHARCATAASTSRPGPGNQQLVHAARAPGRRGRRARRDVLRARARSRRSRAPIQGFGGEAVVGIDAPSGRAARPARRRTRPRARRSACRTGATSACACATRVLFRRGLPLYPVPAADQAIARGSAGWRSASTSSRRSRRSAATSRAGRRRARGPRRRARRSRSGRVCRDLSRRDLLRAARPPPAAQAHAVGPASSGSRRSSSRASSTTTAASGTARSTSSTPAPRPTPPTRWPSGSARGSATRARASSCSPTAELLERYDEAAAAARASGAGVAPRRLHWKRDGTPPRRPHEPTRYAAAARARAARKQRAFCIGALRRGRRPLRAARSCCAPPASRSSASSSSTARSRTRTSTSAPARSRSSSRCSRRPTRTSSPSTTS